jgi:hypothetical protein
VNREYQPAVIPLNKTEGVAVLRAGVFALSFEKDCAEEIRDCRIAIDPNAEIVNLDLCDCYILPFDLGDVLGLIGYLTIRPGSNVIVGKQSFKNRCVASYVRIGCLLYQRQ